MLERPPLPPHPPPPPLSPTHPTQCTTRPWSGQVRARRASPRARALAPSSPPSKPPRPGPPPTPRLSLSRGDPLLRSLLLLSLSLCSPSPPWLPGRASARRSRCQCHPGPCGWCWFGGEGTEACERGRGEGSQNKKRRLLARFSFVGLSSARTHRLRAGSAALTATFLPSARRAAGFSSAARTRSEAMFPLSACPRVFCFCPRLLWLCLGGSKQSNGGRPRALR